MKLGAFLPPPGHHVAAWRHRDAYPDGGLDLAYYQALAADAERGLFDMIFLSDGQGIRTHYRDADELSRWGRVVNFEPITLLSALAVTTRHIGLTATASTSYNEPFNLARKFASLDWISGGRAGWNVVTSVTDAEAQNFNLDVQLDHETRYRRAAEFVQVVTGLWDSFEDDAFIYDKATGRSFTPSKVHWLNHRGEFFAVRGPLSIARCPQGRPVIIQAGSSGTGQAFASDWADVVFTAQQTFEQARGFYANFKQLVADRGRVPDQTLIMPGVFAVVGQTRAEAEDKYASLQALVHPKVGLGLLTGLLGDVDISGYPLDEALPELPPTQGSKSRQELVYEQSRREGMTIRQLYLSLSGSRGHWFLLGSPTEVVDQLEAWFLGGAADGFNVMPPMLPGGLSDFVDLIVPELQRRGLFRKAYDGPTLRDNLGLARPSWEAQVFKS